MPEPTYHDYLREEAVIKDYPEYQERYALEPRESDKMLIRHAVAAVAGTQRPTILDLGCSTGNLLAHLRQAIPSASLTGGEVSQEQLDRCRAEPRLEGIDFEYLDATQLGVEARFDVIIANAVLCILDPDSFEKALVSIGRALKGGGHLLTFDWYHRFPQELNIVERSRSHPDGITLHFRSMPKVEASLRDCGLDEVRFEPFEIPIDLEPGATFGDNESGFEDLNSYTVRAEDGRRLLFRGTLFQPWCHLIARKRTG